MIPVALFAYNRPDMLARTLGALRTSAVPMIYAFSDGARTTDAAAGVADVRGLLRAVDWTRVELFEREENTGLGRSIVAGVSDVLSRHEAVIVCEDDLVIAPGAYAWVAAVLEHYRDEPRVLSASGWTHWRVTPADVGSEPFFSARVNTLFWGTYARAWAGMDQGSAESRLAAFAARGGDPSSYGRDLPEQAAQEAQRNIWAVRFIAEHLARGGLSVCTPWTMVDHIGYDARATNAVRDPTWDARIEREAPPVPSRWPEPVEHARIAALWRASVDVEYGVGRARRSRLVGRVRSAMRRLLGMAPGAA